MDKPNAPATPSGGRPRLALAIVAAGLAVVVVALVLVNRNRPVDTIAAVTDEVVAGFSQGLPKDYGNGLVLERVQVEDRDIVLIMRSTRLSLAAAARDPTTFTQARRNEQENMRQFCSSPAVHQVLGLGLTLTRRFLDTQDRMFFEARLTAKDCL